MSNASSNDLQHRIERMELLHAHQSQRQAPDHSEASHERPAIDDAGTTKLGPSSGYSIKRMELFRAGAYKRLGWEGLARMAWARHRSGVDTDELDRMAMAQVPESDARW